MPMDDELTPTERDALRALATDGPVDPAQEEQTVARLRAAGLLGTTRVRRPWPAWTRVAVAAAAAAVCYLAGVYSGRTMRSAPDHVPTAVAPDTAPVRQAATLAAGAPGAAAAGAPTTIIRF